MDLGREIMTVYSLLVHYQGGKCLQRKNRCSELFQDVQNASEPGPISGFGGDGDTRILGGSPGINQLRLIHVPK